MTKIVIGKLYRHYKGNIYKVIGIAKHSETLEDMVVYQSYENGEMWVRPYKMWDEIVDNKGTHRFSLLENPMR